MDVTVLFSNHGNILPDLVYISNYISHHLQGCWCVCVMAVLRRPVEVSRSPTEGILDVVDGGGSD